jgi:hypothetical protein
MGPNDNQDAEFKAVSGRDQRHRHRDKVSVKFSTYNYVVYEGLGSHLETGFLAFIGGLFSGDKKDFFYVNTKDNLKALFYEDHVNDIPRQFRSFTSSVSGRFIYLFHNSSNTVIEIDYHSPTEYDATTFKWPGKGSLQPERAQTTSGELYRMKLSDLNDTYAIALPYRIDPETIEEIFCRFDTRLLNFCKIVVVNSTSSEGGPERLIRVFDPAHLVAHSAKAIRYYSRLMNIIDARQQVRGLSVWEKNTRERGILACLCKQLAENDSSVKNDANMSQLNNAFDHYANYGFRKARLIDNMYNFLENPPMISLEKALMFHKEGNAHPDGKVWLRIIHPLADLIGEHILLSYYFSDSSQKETQESAWSTFFCESLKKGTSSETPSVQLWNSAMQGTDISKLLVGVAEARTYQLVTSYTTATSQMNWRNFNSTLKQELEAMKGKIRSIGRADAITQRLKQVDAIFAWAKRLGNLKAVFDGEVATSDFVTVLDSLAVLADRKGAVAMASKMNAVKNMLDVFQNSVDFAKRININDYDAALGHGLALGAGLAEIGYFVVTGSTLGGPVGAAVAIVGAVGGVIIIFATDSDAETFMGHCIWGKEFGKSSDKPDWAAHKLDWWKDSSGPFGIRSQIASLLNILHKYTVRHTFDVKEKLLEIEINTKFLPDTARFEFKGEFRNSRGKTVRAKFSIRFPSRRKRYSKALKIETPTSLDGYRILRYGNVRVITEGGEHKIHIRLKVSDGVTSGEGWLRCYPFGHSEFNVPHGVNAFHLEKLIKHTKTLINTWRDYDFEKKEWGFMPSW